jgi:hypothetical protein
VAVPPPYAGPKAIPVSFKLFPSFHHHSVTGVRRRADCMCSHGHARDDAHPRRGMTGVRSARTPVPRSQNPAPRPRTGPGSPSRSSNCTRPWVTTRTRRTTPPRPPRHAPHRAARASTPGLGTFADRAVVAQLSHASGTSATHDQRVRLSCARFSLSTSPSKRASNMTPTSTPPDAPR